MLALLVVSLIWSFSFGFIKANLASLDANFVAAARLLIAALVFLPLLRVRKLAPRDLGRLALVGAVQYGLMYLTYIASFKYLQSYQVALFTAFTPIYVTLIHDAFERKLNWLNLLTALVAVLGSTVIINQSERRDLAMAAFVVLQVSNLCFAFGQIAYQRWMREMPNVADQDVFGLLYLAGFLTAGAAAAVFTPWGTFQLTGAQAASLLYLGVVASGVGFFLWNYGARRVDAGVLAIMNDLKIPLAVVVSLLIFGEKANMPRLLVGGGLLLAALVMQRLGTRMGLPRNR